MSLVDQISSLDRRWVFLALAISVAVPLMTNIILPTKVTPEVQDFYNSIENLPDGSLVLVSADYDPGSQAELLPMHTAVMEHLARKGHKIISMGLWPGGLPLAEELLETVVEGKFNYDYGEDFVNLGFMSGNIVVIKGIGNSFEATFKTDERNSEPVSEVPMMRGVKNITNIDLIVTLSAGFPGIPEWVQVARDSFGVPLIGGCTAVSAPQLYPFLKGGQLGGLLGGLKGAAEYEHLLDPEAEMLEQIGKARQGMTAQSFAHLLIMLLIVVGNVTYFIQRSKARSL